MDNRNTANSLRLGVLLALAAALAGGGCVAWTPGWESAGEHGQAAGRWLREQAEITDIARLEDPAVFRAVVEAQLAEAVSVGRGDPDYPTAQVEASQLSLLLGAGFARDRREQRALYLRAAQHAERALHADARFRERVEAGEPVWVAGAVLEPEGFEPLFLWSTAIFYLFRDVLGVPEMVFARKHLDHAGGALAHMLERDPDWNDGVLLFSMGIYRLSVPGIMGGDRAEARRLINLATGMGDRRLLPRWGRAKYLAVATGDRETFQSDLRWVLAQDPQAMAGPLLWNVYFQQDARALLESADRLF